jgi:hypothetical protein
VIITVTIPAKYAKTPGVAAVVTRALKKEAKKYEHCRHKAKA